MKSRELIQSIDALAAWWLDKDDDGEETSAEEASISLIIEDGFIIPMVHYQEGSEDDFVRLLYKLCTGKLVTTILEELSKSIGIEAVAEIYQKLSDMHEEEHKLDREDEEEAEFLNSKPIIKPSEVFNEI